MGFNEGELKNFRLKVQEILNFEWFLSLEIKLNYIKGFEKEKLVLVG